MGSDPLQRPRPDPATAAPGGLGEPPAGPGGRRVFFPRRRRAGEAPRSAANPAEYWTRADLRRRRSRAYAEEVLRRAEALPPDQVALLRAVYVDHVRMTHLAALTHTPIRSLRRRIRSLARRVMSDEFAFVVRRAHAWPDPQRRVAESVVVMGKSYRQTGDDLGLSLHTVRRHSATIYAMCEAARQLAEELASVAHAAGGSRDA